MSDGTAIEWTDASWNPLRARNPVVERFGWHCEPVSEGCRNCYAAAFNRRLGTGLDYKPGYRGSIEIYIDEKALLLPLKWKKPRRIFVCSMTDLFADFVTDEMIDRVFAVMALASQHQFQVLTKRSARMRAYCASRRHDTVYSEMAVIRGVEGTHDLRVDWPLPNVWLGVSAEDQKRADERLPHLISTPAAVRFISAEPLLGPLLLQHSELIDGKVRNWLGAGGLDWVIVGGESGPNARPMHPDWARSLRDQCQAAGVPFFFKQHGEWAPFYYRDDGEPRKSFTFNDGVRVHRIGKAAAWRNLDNRTHDDMPLEARG